MPRVLRNRCLPPERVLFDRSDDSNDSFNHLPMHARQLVEIAGIVAYHAPAVVLANQAPGTHHLDQYWASSKSRYESWSRHLKVLASLPPEPLNTDLDRWIELRGVLDEIFLSEMLTRVWTAVLAARDRRLGISEAEPLARSVLGTQLEARHRAMALLLHGRGLSIQQAASLNRLRRRVERWTDVLIGGMSHLGDVREFAIEPDRADDFAAALAWQRRQPGGQQAWRLTMVSLANAFQAGLCPDPANPDANARITASILGCFQAEVFDSTGSLQSLWLLRLAANTTDVQGMLSDLLHEPAVATKPPRAHALRRRRI